MYTREPSALSNSTTLGPKRLTRALGVATYRLRHADDPQQDTHGLQVKSGGNGRARHYGAFYAISATCATADGGPVQITLTLRNGRGATALPFFSTRLERDSADHHARAALADDDLNGGPCQRSRLTAVGTAAAKVSRVFRSCVGRP